MSPGSRHHSGKAFCRRAVELPELLQIDPQRKPVADPPRPRHHHLVGTGRAAKDQRGQRVVASREAQFIEFEEGQIRLVARLDPADPADTETSKRVPLLAQKTMIDGKPAAYVCRNFACKQPTTEPAELTAQLQGKQPTPKTEP